MAILAAVLWQLGMSEDVLLFAPLTPLMIAFSHSFWVASRISNELDTQPEASPEINRAKETARRRAAQKTTR